MNGSMKLRKSTLRTPATLRRVLLFTFLLASLSTLRAFGQYNAPSVQVPPQGNATVLTTDPSILYPPAPTFHIVPGDVLAVKVFGQSDYQGGGRVDLNGDIELPFLGIVHVNGMTIPEVETFLASRLQQAGIYNSPQVSVTVGEGPNVVATLLGEVRGAVPIYGQRGLLDVLTASGGLPAAASHIVTINRPGVPAPIVVDLGTDPAHSTAANIPIFPGDIIVTGHVGVAFAIGAFKSPGVIPLAGNTPVTLMQAASSIGGPAYEAKPSDLRLIRTINGQRTVVKLDIEKILYGKAPDPVLEPNDILFLPTNGMKAWVTNGSGGLVFSLAGLVLSIANFARQ